MTQGAYISMSAPQGSFGCRISVDPSTADVLRIEAKKVLMFNHEPFEDFLDYVRRDRVEVPMTRGHIEQLHRRRCDLLDTNLDLLTDIGADNQQNAIVMSEIYANRHGVEALNRVFDAYGDTIAT